MIILPKKCKQMRYMVCTFIISIPTGPYCQKIINTFPMLYLVF